MSLEDLITYGTIDDDGSIRSAVKDINITKEQVDRINKEIENIVNPRMNKGLVYCDGCGVLHKAGSICDNDREWIKDF